MTLTSQSDNFYTPIEEAVEEIHRRRKSNSLLKKIREEVKLTPELEILNEKPHLVMFRQVLTPLTETIEFMRLAKKHSLSPLVIEYYEDKFVSTGNQFKRGLGKLPIFKFRDNVGTDVFEYMTILDFNTQVGKPIDSIRTLKDESLIKLHHELFLNVLGVNPLLVAKDGTSWFSKYDSSRAYYTPFLKFFLRDAILFESFVSNNSEQEFFDTVVLPSFKSCEQDYLNPWYHL
jgi:hypothetical protein